MNGTPKANRLHIGIFGKRNAGKSSLLNTLVNQDVSIVSNIPGTTTDPVEKTMEFLPLGPVVFIDTAGIDDINDLGRLRIEKTKKILDRVDIAVIVSDFNGWDRFETELFNNFQQLEIPVIAVITKNDIQKISDEKLSQIKQHIKNPIQTSLKDPKDKSANSSTVAQIKEQLVGCVPENFINPPSIIEGLIESGQTAVLVIPIDKEAPKGRIILPQVQTLRALLDNGNKTLVVRDSELSDALNELKETPAIVITDSQAFKSVAEITDVSIPLTSFSILFARLKGDLKEFYTGAKTIDNLQNGDRILIAESCSHHQIEDDIARVKIPKLLKNKTGRHLEFFYHSSHDFAENLQDYALIIHCGACMTNRREILSRILKAKNAGIPITNYGIAIAHCLGILERAIAPFKIHT